MSSGHKIGSRKLADSDQTLGNAASSVASSDSEDSLGDGADGQPDRRRMFLHVDSLMVPGGQRHLRDLTPAASLADMRQRQGDDDDRPAESFQVFAAPTEPPIARSPSTGLAIAVVDEDALVANPTVKNPTLAVDNNYFGVPQIVVDLSPGAESPIAAVPLPQRKRTNTGDSSTAAPTTVASLPLATPASIAIRRRSQRSNSVASSITGGGYLLADPRREAPWLQNSVPPPPHHQLQITDGPFLPRPAIQYSLLGDCLQSLLDPNSDGGP